MCTVDIIETVDQIGEFLKEAQRNHSIELPISLVEILRSAPEQDNTPRELVEWIKQVSIEKRHIQYNDLFTLNNLTKCIAIRNYYSPIQLQKANERASLELSNRSNCRKIDRNLGKLTN